MMPMCGCDCHRYAILGHHSLSFYKPCRRKLTLVYHSVSILLVLILDKDLCFQIVCLAIDRRSNTIYTNHFFSGSMPTRNIQISRTLYIGNLYLGNQTAARRGTDRGRYSAWIIHLTGLVEIRLDLTGNLYARFILALGFGYPDPCLVVSVSVACDRCGYVSFLSLSLVIGQFVNLESETVTLGIVPLLVSAERSQPFLR